MPTTNIPIDFNAPATLRKYPSLAGVRSASFEGQGSYLIVDGTLDACIRKFLEAPER